jgi:hypothetical protein
MKEAIASTLEKIEEKLRLASALLVCLEKFFCRIYIAAKDETIQLAFASKQNYPLELYYQIEKVRTNKVGRHIKFTNYKWSIHHKNLLHAFLKTVICTGKFSVFFSSKVFRTDLFTISITYLS